jgi:transcription initiation factor TFIID subunit TAF12
LRDNVLADQSLKKHLKGVYDLCSGSLRTQSSSSSSTANNSKGKKRKSDDEPQQQQQQQQQHRQRDAATEGIRRSPRVKLMRK